MDIKTFQDKLGKGDAFVVKFGANWCQPCKTVDAVLAKFDDPRIFKIDIDEEPDLALELNVSSIPTILFASNNDYIRIKGVDPHLSNKLQEFLS